MSTRGSLAPLRKDSLKPGWLAQRTQKITLSPPIGDANKVKDFFITDHADGSYSLSWHYRNVGDYDQNGTVGVSDITPLAQHFGETYDTETEFDTIQAVVDGSSNGAVGIEDVTPIAMNFGVACTGYSLRISQLFPTYVNDTTGIDVIPLNLGQREGRVAFSVDHTLPPFMYISLAPVDSLGEPGALSNVELTPNHNPVASLYVSPSQADPPFTAELDASQSYDVDGPIIKYEWDFEGDGVWDIESFTVSHIGHAYETSDFYYPVVRVTDANGATGTAEATVFAGHWRIATVASNLTPFISAISLKAVNGNPAMSYYAKPELSTEGFYYIRSNDSLGQSWGNAIQFTHNMIGSWENCDDSLSVVNGRPAIAAMGDNEDWLLYSQAEDADGASWGAPLEVCYSNSSEDSISMAVVDGYPAIAYDHGRLSYVRALDADGTYWGTPVEIAWSGGEPSLAIVNGLPAISFRDPEENCLYHIRASDPEGQSWGEPVIVDSLSGAVRGGRSSLAIVNGNPAIAYEAAIYTTDWINLVKYVRANDENGSSWGAPQTLAEYAQLGYDTSLAVINGRPAICYLGFDDFSLRYISAADADGRKWRAPMIISTNNVSQFSMCLQEVSGHPAIGYFDKPDYHELKFAIYY